MADDDRNIEYVKKLVGILDDALTSAEWKGSLLLETAGKKITKLRDDANNLLKDLQAAAVEEKSKGSRARSNMSSLETVYVSIYQHDPDDIRKWESTLKSIAEYSASRSIYQGEEEIKEMIRSRPDPNKEGYVVALVRRSDIIKGGGGKAAVDALGHKLLTVREGAVRPNALERFVHGDKIYGFEGGALQLQSDNTEPE